METVNEKKTRKFNIIDLLIILVVIAAIVVVVYKFAGKKIVESVSTKEYYMTFVINEVADTTAEHVFEGDALTDNAGNNSLGTVYKVFKDENSHSMATNSDGIYVPSDKPGFCCLTVVGKVNAVEETNGITVNGAKYLVGHTMTLEAGDAKIYCLITDISENAPDESKLAGVSIGAKAE